MAKAKFYVIDEEGLLSWSDKTKAAESFATEAAALRRARDLAEYVPGKDITIYKAVTIVYGRGS